MAYRDEIARLEAMHAANPDGRVFAHLAEAYRKAGELERARDVLTAGLERHPSYASAHVVLGRVLTDLADSEGADRAFGRVLELDPHNMVALRARADIAHAAGRGDDALQHYRELLTLDPSDEHASLRVLEIESAAPQPAAGPVPEPDAEPEPAEFGSPAVPAPETPASRPSSPAASSAAPVAAAEPVQPASLTESAEPVPTFEALPLDGVETNEAAPVDATDDVDLGLGGLLEPTDLGAGAGAALPLAADVAPEGELAPTAALDPAALLDTGDAPPPTADVDELPDAAPDAVLDLAGLEGSFAIPDDAESAQPVEPVEPLPTIDLPGFDEIAADATPVPLAPLPTAPADEPAPAPAPALPIDLAAGTEPAVPASSAVEEFDALWGAHDDGAAAALPDLGPELVTETIADLYAQQGLHARAADVYRRLLETRPGDERIREKLDAAHAAANASDHAIGTWAARTEAERRSPEAQPEQTAPPPYEPPSSLTETAAESGLTAADAFAAPADAEPEATTDAAAFDLPMLEPLPAEEEVTSDLPLLGLDLESRAPGEPSATEQEPPFEAAHGPGVEPLGGGDMLAPPPAVAENDALESVESAWTGSGGAAAHTDSPFGWAEPEAAPEQSTIGDYLESLLAWQPPAPPETTQAPEPTVEPTAAPAPPAAPEPFVAAPEPFVAAPEPFLAPQPPAPEPVVAAPEPFVAPQPPAATEPVAASAASSPPELGVDDIEALFGDAPKPAPEISALFGAASKPGADPLDDIDALFGDAPTPAPVTTPQAAPPARPQAEQPQPAPTQAAPTQGAPTQAPPAAPGAAAGAAGAAFEWDPLAELPVAPPTEPAASEAPAAEPAPAETTSAPADDDEDIDMFRAWLQSLKR
ncbi:MAG TPA: tetratricopeptide repeat protein [Longimicrobiales bacterium]